MNSIGSEGITLRGTPGERQKTVLLDTSIPLTSTIMVETLPESKTSRLPLFLSLLAVLAGIVVFVIHSIETLSPETSVPSGTSSTEIRSIQVETTDQPHVIKKLSLTEFNDLNKRIKDSENHSEAAETYYQHGDYANAMEQYNLALGDFMQIIEYFEKTVGSKNENSITTYKNIAATYSNLGEVCRSDKRYGEALEWLKKAMQINEKAAGTDHLSTGSIYNKIAMVYDNQGQYGNALEWYHKTLVINEKGSRERSAKTCNNIGMVHFHLGDRPQAMEWFRKALVIQESVDMESPDTAITRNNIAEIYRVQGDYVLALPEYLRAYRVLRKNFGERNPSTRAVKENLARAYDKSDNPKSFVEWLEDSLL